MRARSNCGRWLSLRLRFALWSGGLLLLGGILLVLFVNLTAPKMPPSSIRVVVPRTVTARNNEGRTVARPINPGDSRRPLATPGNSTVGGTVVIIARTTTSSNTVVNGPVSAPPPSAEPQPLTPLQVQLASFLGLGLLILLGGVGAYWLAGHALRPVRAVSQAARHIDPTKLDTRLALDGPDDEVQDLARSFDAMLDRLQQSFDQQGRFVADAAHELRTPLANLRATLDTMQSLSGDDEQQTFVATFERQLTRLEHLVADLLLLAREDAPLVREPLTLGVLLEDVIDQLHLLASSRGVRLLHATGAVESVIVGDSPLLTRVFVNLVENGLLHTSSGGIVKVIVTWEVGFVSVAVTDTGVGIAPAERDHIFERFYRGDRSRSRNRGGVGLGLSIVADAVRRHGGRVTLDSHPGRGSTFTVILPVSSVT